MSINTIMPLVFVQDMGPAARVAHDSATQPEAAQAKARAMAEELLREESKQVQKLEENAAANEISGEDKGSGGGGYGGKRRRKKDERQEDTRNPQSLDPFIGKLINTKV